MVFKESECNKHKDMIVILQIMLLYFYRRQSQRGLGNLPVLCYKKNEKNERDK